MIFFKTDINTISTNEHKSEYAELIFETHLVLPSWEDQNKQGFFFLIIIH